MLPKFYQYRFVWVPRSFQGCPILCIVGGSMAAVGKADSAIDSPSIPVML